MAVLTPALVRLRSDFDRIAPKRDRTSDGWIGDAAHQQTNSDHNPDSRGRVHAVDIDADLRIPRQSMEDFVQHIIARQRTGADNRLTYVIYRRRIWSVTYGWARRRYGGSNPHDTHAHFSGSNKPSRETDTHTYRLEDVIMPSIDEIRAVVRAELAAQRDDIAREVWAHRLDIDTTSAGTNPQPAGGILAYTSSEHHRIEDKVNEVIERLPALPPPVEGDGSTS